MTVRIGLSSADRFREERSLEQTSNRALVQSSSSVFKKVASASTASSS